MAVIHAIAGPIEGAVFHLPHEEVVVGRLSSSHLCIGDPSVSRQHCTVQPGAGGFRIRDLGSNNGTFVNGRRVEDCILTDGDRIRVGDTVLAFVENGAMSLPDNGVTANSCIQAPAAQSAETAVRSLLDAIPEDSGFGARARALLRIGARLNTNEEPDEMTVEVLKLILEAAPADRGAIVWLSQDPNSEPTITGWNRSAGGPSGVSVSRTLVSRAIQNASAIFTADVSSIGEFDDIASLSRRRVQSVIVVPLGANGRITGAIYLESDDPVNRLDREHMEFVAAVADHAGPAMERARRLKILREGGRRAQGGLALKHNLIGVSPPMREISARIAKVARTDATVMIRGETGTGKELAARAIHENSARAARPFEAINCPLLRDALLESELFGHERGSFTGAVAQQKGILEIAEGGTVFLDELAAMGESSQAMLLRVLQTREFRRLGGNRTLHADVRIIAATNEDLEEAVRKKTFRQDLYYRLNVVSLAMPPLRARPEDIPLLADHFAQTCSRKNKRPVAGVSSEAAALLMRYDWPGNVRELENAIEYAIVFGSTTELLPEDFPESLLGLAGAAESAGASYHQAVRDAKRNIVLSALRCASSDYNRAARHLGIHVNNLHRLIRELQLKSLLTNTSEQ